ncbi:putative glycosyl hydrolase, GH43/DUF377 family [Abditibacterium utsteinense]|uniref:Putative glycosyl hydrolase, GH43/DUF377 family n=1 Tax=Abditibacterium utsteinense TaxID=1960156 RepID=A0A2S8SRT1_9BACT|nr:glycoside hydrolase family 130 protein [Abditibacterium utsteinense]PQV63514.1 putative glycosyl hydrolase, GH43/DUF377 family [Abditibacterium utsteinense]
MTSLASGSPLPDWGIGPFVRPNNATPVIEPNPNSVFYDPMRGCSIRWESLHTFNPAATVKDGKIVVLYRAEDDTGSMNIGQHTSRLGFAYSEDGLHFKRLPAPVFYPDNDSQKDAEWEGGCEDPRLVVTQDGTYVLTYTQWNHKIARLAVATSIDLITWTKHGSAFSRALGGKYATTWSKSGAIVVEEKDGILVAAKMGDKYWMYYGEFGVCLASSTDLIHWTPEERDGQPLVLLDKRAGKFDSDFAEGGPPAVLTERGIVVMYNGKNAEQGGDPAIEANAYSAGQALFDRNDPTKMLARTDKPFFQPEQPFEKSGQYTAGTTFVEGLVLFKGQWFLYYGTADSFVGVAVCK